MGDSEDPKPKRVPTWQRSESSPSEKDTAKEAEESAMPDERRRTLLEDAAKFLDDEDIRDAPTERKKVFLGSKGMTENQIQDLLEQQEQDRLTPEAEVMEDYGIEKEDLERPNSTSASNADSEPPSSTTNVKVTTSKAISTDQREPASSTPPTKDVPPIITYPEFLLHSHKPPPLITARRLLTTLYVASGTAATVYGTNKYIVEPMIESLTSARHSLAETASNNIDTLNAKLESAVSRIPDYINDANEEDKSDVESIDSDPSRFFSRSAATQTSPDCSHSLSSTSSEDLTATEPNKNHINNVLAIHSKLTDLKPKEDTSPVKDSIHDLRKFLDNLPDTNATSQNGKLWEKTTSDECGRLKAEIRGVKGVLLSARNFPSSVSVR